MCVRAHGTRTTRVHRNGGPLRSHAASAQAYRGPHAPCRHERLCRPERPEHQHNALHRAPFETTSRANLRHIFRPTYIRTRYEESHSYKPF